MVAMQNIFSIKMLVLKYAVKTLNIFRKFGKILLSESLMRCQLVTC